MSVCCLHSHVKSKIILHDLFSCEILQRGLEKWKSKESILAAYLSNLNRIIVLQKKIIRIISKVSFDAHTGVLFKEQEIFKFSDIYLYQIGKFMYLFKRGLVPNYFRDMFILASQIHSYNTRNSNLFHIPYCRTNLRKFSIRFQAPTFYKSLSREIQNSESVSLFGKKFLLS